jgi:hypothetical protein
MMASGEIRLSGTISRRMPVLAQSQTPGGSTVWNDPNDITAGVTATAQSQQPQIASLAPITVTSTRLPDYVTFQLDLYVFSVSATYTSYGDIFLNKGFSRSYPYPSVKKVGVSISDGWMLSPTNAVPSQSALNNFLSDWSGSAGGYFGVGGSYSFNSAGSAINLGVGFGGFGASPGTIGTYQGNVFGSP